MTEEKRNDSWWKTIPGILTGITASLTAVAGLIATLYQVGILGESPQIPHPNQSLGRETIKLPEKTHSSTSEDTTEPAKADLELSAPQYQIISPSGSEMSLLSFGNPLIYTLLSSRVENRNTGKLIITFTIRMTNKGDSFGFFEQRSFRLIVDGVSRAPISGIETKVSARSAAEGDILFDLPETTKSLLLEVTAGKETGREPDTARLTLILKKIR